MRSILAGLRTLVLPWGSASTSPRIVIGANPVPPELVTYYQNGAPETWTAPETVVGVTLNYDGQGNYGYQGLVVDSSSPTKRTSLVFGTAVSGTVREFQRTVLNPGIPNGVVTAFYRNELFLEADVSTYTVLAAGVTTDTFGRFELNGAGAHYWGPGGASDTDTVLWRSAAGVLSAPAIVGSLDAVNPGSAETWHSMTLLNSWTNFGGGFVTAQYRLVPSPAKSIQIVGVIAPGTKTDGTVVATLPIGYRPTNTVRFPVAQDGGASPVNPRMDIGSNGNLAINGLNLTGLAAVEFNEIIPLDA